ncbi:MAG: ACT domain-containing protein [Thermaerobacter sp.]|nr:ACT domain-containing protein [Thermaerobacter sp.]
MMIYFQGEPGAFSEAAVVRYFPDAEPSGQESFDAVFRRLAAEPGAMGLLPIENAYRGTVYDVLDLLTGSDLTIWAEVVQPVTLALLGLPGQRLSDIRRVRSHPQALMQSRSYWQGQGWHAEPALDTAGSAKDLARHRWPEVGAIASPRSADIYGLVVLAAPIEDHADNRTRFWLLRDRPGPEPTWEVEGLKASLVFDAPDTPGSLVRVLEVFSRRSINLSKVETRPRPGHPFGFRFWLDAVVAPDQRARLEQAMTEAIALVDWHRVLGYYPVAAYRP